MRFEHRFKVRRTARCRSDVRLEVLEERVENGVEEDDLLVGDLIENRNEGADGLEEVELGIEDGWSRGGFSEDGYGGRFRVGERGGNDEKVLCEESRQSVLPEGERGRSAPASPSRWSARALPRRSPG